MKQLNLAQTAILKFIENKDLTTKRTSFTGKWAKYSKELRGWVEGNPKWTQGDDLSYCAVMGNLITVKWTDKTVTITKAQIRPRTMEYCVDAPSTYGDATMRHS